MSLYTLVRTLPSPGIAAQGNVVPTHRWLVMMLYFSAVQSCGWYSGGGGAGHGWHWYLECLE